MKIIIRFALLFFLKILSYEGTCQNSRKPNVVLLFSDDQRLQGTIHALGGNEVITPNLDALVKSGTAFTKTYIMGGSQGAVCVPSRNMLMTGRNLFSLVSVGADVIFPENTTLGEALGNNGYSTYGIGKWHNDKASFNRIFQNGDEIFFGGMSNNPYNVGLFHYDNEGKYSSKGSPEKGELISKGLHSYPKHHTEVFGEAAVKFIENYQKKEPFFLYVAFKSPHDPRVMPEKYKEMYDTSKINLPLNFMREHPFDNGELKVRDEMLATFPRTPSEVKGHIRDYYAMMTHLDEQIGKIVEALKAKGEYENTIIVFAGDNGLALGQHGLMGKQNVYEHSLNVPLIIAGKGIPKGKLNNNFAYSFDIFPTICQLTGTAIPPSVQGQVLFGNNKNTRETMFHAYRNFQRALRKGDWKLIEYNVNEKKMSQLFNLKKDPLELNNLANDPQFHIKLTEMKTALKDQKRIYNCQVSQGCCQNLFILYL